MSASVLRAIAAAAAVLAGATVVRADPTADRLPAGSLVTIELVEAVSSATAKRGDTFAIRLAKPIVVGEAVVVPAGTLGRGEVIDAASGAPKLMKPAKPSKLILAARYLEFDGSRIPLRGFHLSAAEINSSDTISIFGGGGVAYSRTAASREAVVPAGALGEAKLSVDVDLAGHVIPTVATSPK